MPRREHGTAASVGARVRARRYTHNIDGVPFASLVQGHPPLVDLTQGMQIIVGYRVAVGLDENLYFAGPLPVDPATNTLTHPWMQFPVGTPASQILDRSEWGNPARGCNPSCRVEDGRYYPPTYSDASPDVLPVDASDVPTND